MNILTTQVGLSKKLMGRKELDIYINKVNIKYKQLNKYYNEVKLIKSSNNNDLEYLHNQINQIEKRINKTTSNEVNILTTEEMEKKQMTIKEKEDLIKKY